MINRLYLFCVGVIVIASICAILPFGDTLAARAPTMGKILENDINIRTDSTVNAYSIGTLNRNAQVEIIGEKYGWFKIRLPEGSTCYVSGDHVKRVGRDTVQVQAFSLNMRLSATLDAPIIGKVREGTILTLVGSKGAWVKVIAYPYAWGWIHKKFIEEQQVSDEKKDSAARISPEPERSKVIEKQARITPPRKFVTVQRPLVSAKVIDTPPPEPEVKVVKREVVDFAEPAASPPASVEPKKEKVAVAPKGPVSPVAEILQVAPRSSPGEEEVLAGSPTEPPHVRVIAGEVGPKKAVTEESEPVAHIVEPTLTLKPEAGTEQVTAEDVSIIEKVVSLARKTPVEPTMSAEPAMPVEVPGPKTMAKKIVKVLKGKLDIEPFTNARLDDPRVYGVLEHIDQKTKGCRANFKGQGQGTAVLLKIDQEKFDTDSFVDKKVEIRGKVKDEGCLYIDVQTLSLL